MHLKTAIQRIVELEKVRLLEEGKSLASFDPTVFFSVPADDLALLARRYGEQKTDAKHSQFLFELDYQNNPLIDITAVIMEEQEGSEGTRIILSIPSNGRSKIRHIVLATVCTSLPCKYHA
jgi:hypothetical protein